jgi:hypothetical protein
VSAEPAASPEASAEPSNLAAASAEPDPSAGLRVMGSSADLRGVRVCVVNDRSDGQRPAARLNVKFTNVTAVSFGSELVSPKDQRCGQTPQGLLLANVEGQIGIMYILAQDMEFKTQNPSDALAGLLLQLPGGKKTCAGVAGVGNTDVYDDGDVRYTVKRLPNFLAENRYPYVDLSVTVSDSQGAQGTCEKPGPLTPY